MLNMLTISGSRARSWRLGGGVSAALGLALAAGACAPGPIERDSDALLRSSLIESVRREVREAEEHPEPRAVEREDRLAELEIEERFLEEIRQEYDPRAYLEELAKGAPDGFEVDPVETLLNEDLFGRDQRVAALDLGQAIRTGVERNLNVQVARLAPAIQEAQVVAAEAAFDWAVFGTVQWEDQDGPQLLGGTVFTQSQQGVTGNVGLERTLETGGLLTVQQLYRYQDDRGSGGFDGLGGGGSDPATHTFEYRLNLRQPLLAGAGTSVNRSEIYLAQNAERRAVSALRRSLIDTATEIEQAYWDLVVAKWRLIIQAKLLQRGIEVRDEVRIRRIQDARSAQVADAVARVERRRAELLRAQTELRRQSDRLKALINDPALPVGGETLILPTDAALDEPISFSLLDAVSTAMANRPDLEQAVLAIDDASIRQMVARNLRLPTLDLITQLNLVSLDTDAGDAYEGLADGEFIDGFIFGVDFRQELGNRAANANYRRSRLERMQSVIEFRLAAQQAVLEVKNALREVELNYRLIEQARISRIAQAEALRTLVAEKLLTPGGYTVERLNLQLNQQEQLAQAELEEIRAVVTYNASIAQLYRATGTTLERNRIDFIVPDANQILPGERALDYVVPGGEGE